VLRQKLRKHHLLGEKFGPDGDFRWRSFFAGGDNGKDAEEVNEAKEKAANLAHVR
jgi:hypothetical protein